MCERCDAVWCDVTTVRWRDLGLERVVRKMEVGIGEEQERSRLGELAEEVMQKELRAQRQELDDIERAGYAFEGTRLEVVADEVSASFFASLKNRILFSIFNLGSRAGHRKIFCHRANFTLFQKSLHLFH